MVSHVMQAKKRVNTFLAQVIQSYTFFSIVDDMVACYNQCLVYLYSKVSEKNVELSCKLLPTCVLFSCSAQNLQYFTVHRALVYVRNGKTRQDSLGYGIKKTEFYYRSNTFQA